MATTYKLPALVVALAIAAIPALAHHAFSSEFDTSKPITLQGVVTRVDWENPHVHFYVDVADKNGAVVNWACESRGPNNLIKRGWNMNSMKSGDKVIVHGFLARDGANSVDGRDVTLADGRRILTGDAH